MSGYLKQKKGSRWKSNWFVLKDRVLYTYKASEDTVAVETVPVLGWQLEPLSDVSITDVLPDYAILESKVFSLEQCLLFVEKCTTGSYVTACLLVTQIYEYERQGPAPCTFFGENRN